MEDITCTHITEAIASLNSLFVNLISVDASKADTSLCLHVRLLLGEHLNEHAKIKRSVIGERERKYWLGSA